VLFIEKDENDDDDDVLVDMMSHLKICNIFFSAAANSSTALKDSQLEI
jgi:hypothetical protein